MYEKVQVCSLGPRCFEACKHVYDKITYWDHLNREFEYPEGSLHHATSSGMNVDFEHTLGLNSATLLIGI